MTATKSGESDLENPARPIGRNQTGRLDRLRNTKRLALFSLAQFDNLAQKTRLSRTKNKTFEKRKAGQSGKRDRSGDRSERSGKRGKRKRKAGQVRYC